MTCRVLKFAKQPYYRWLANPVSKRDWDEAQLINAAIDIHVDDPAFGYRFIADELAEASTVSPAAAPRPTTPLARLPATVHFSSVGTVQNSSVVDRAPHQRGEALSLRDERHLLQPHRRLFDR